MGDITTFYVNSLRECTYVFSSTGRECIIVDPGCQNDRERARIDDFIAERSLSPVCIFLTHAHFDHVLSLAWFARKWNIPAVLGAGDVELLGKLQSYTKMFGMEYLPTDDVEFRYVSDGDEISYAGFNFRVMATPGHTPGCVCYIEEREKLMFSGDTLFQGSIGSTDFEEGCEEDMYVSLAKIRKLDPGITVYPGHGYPTTIAEELRTNPYLR